MHKETEKLRKKLDEAGVPYTCGYVVGGKRINKGIATNITCKNGQTLSFEEDLAGRFTLFDLTVEQAFEMGVFLY